MSSLLDKYKQQRSTHTDLAEKLNKEASGGGGNYEQDSRYWFPERDKSGNAYSLIRHLPPYPGEELPFVKYFKHNYKNDDTGRWLIELCPTTFGKDCPVCEANKEAWNAGNEKLARDRKRKIRYIDNVYIVDDPQTEENNGKVFLFDYGQQIHDIIMKTINPDPNDPDPDIVPINIYDLWEGANFKFKIRKENGQTTYKHSTFEGPSQIAPTDEEMEKILQMQYPVEQEVVESQLKSYEDIKKRFNYVEGVSGSGTTNRTAEKDMEEDSGQSMPEETPTSAPAEEPTPEPSDGGDDDLESFRSMLDDD